MVALDAIVSKHLVGKRDLPIDHDQIQRVKASLLSGGVAGDSIEIRLTQPERGEFAFGGKVRRAGVERPVGEFRVNAATLGNDPEMLEQVGRLLDETKGWPGLEHPLVVRLAEEMHVDRAPVPVSGGQWMQVGTSTVDQVMGEIFAPEARFYALAHPEKADQYSHMISFRKHVAAAYGRELVSDGTVGHMASGKRVVLARELNAQFRQAGMLPVFRAAANVFMEPMSLATEVVVSSLWNMGTQRRQANWPSGDGLRAQHLGQGLEGWRGPAIISSLVYPVLAGPELRKQLDASAPTDQVLRSQAVRSLMHAGIGPGDSDFDERWRGMMAGIPRHTGGVIDALIRAGRMLRDNFATLEEAKLNVRVTEDTPPGLPGAIPFRAVGYSWGYQARRVKRKERKGKTTFSLVYSQENIGTALAQLLGVPPLRGRKPDGWVPSLEINGVVGNDGSMSVAAFIRGEADRVPKGGKFKELMKFHTVLFAQALHDLAVGQHRGRIKLTGGQDSHYTIVNSPLPDAERVVKFARDIIGGQVAEVLKPLELPVGSISHPQVPELMTLPAGKYRRDPHYRQYPVFPHTMLVPVDGTGGTDLDRDVSIHNQSLAEGRWQGVSVDRWDTTIGVSATADNDRMPTLLFGLNIQGRSEGWGVSPDEVVFRPDGLHLPHMLVNGQAASLEMLNDIVALTLEPLLPGDEGVREEYTMPTAEARAAAANLRDMYRQLRMFGKTDPAFWDDNVARLAGMDGEARRLGLRLQKVALREKGNG